MAERPAPLIVTLDIGSSSTRALLFDASGAAVPGAAAQVKYELATSPDGGAELDAERMMVRVAACLDELLHEAGPLAGAIGAVALDTFVGNVLGVDGEGQAVTPVYTWADTRAAPWAAGLRRQLDPAAVWQRTGCPLHSSYLPARLAWLAAERPRLFGAARRWLSFGEFVLERLCGQRRLSTSVASWGGLLDRRSLAWDAELIAALPIDAGQLGEPVDASQSITGLAPEFALRWPALRAVPWFPAIGDGAGSNLGCGAAGPERVALNLGTSGALRVVAGAVERVPGGLWCYRVDARRSLLGGSISNAGNLFAWLRETLRLPEDELFEAHLAAAEPAGHGLVALPFLAGERSPGFADDARAAISGARLHTGAADLAQALLESAAYTVDAIYRRLLPLLPAEHELIASGGAALRSPAWQQMICDTLGRPLSISSVEEATARGTALLALEYLGRLAEADRLALPIGRRLEPDAARHRAYQAAAARQAELYQALIAPA